MVQKVGLDNGKGHLQMALTVYDNVELYKEKERSGRGCRADGIQPKDSSQMSVNRVILLAIAPQVPESWQNVDVFLERTRIKEILFSFSGDLKMLHICGGLGSGSSRHCCLYCEVARVKGEWASSGQGASGSWAGWPSTGPTISTTGAGARPGPGLKMPSYSST